MAKEFSLYLDLVRVLAAIVVLWAHLNLRVLTTAILPGDSLGHVAVIFFFVLSGYVIAHVTTTRERESRTFATNRIARIYSVAIPALAVTLIADALGRQLNPALYLHTPADHAAVRLLISLGMMNEAWGLSVMAFSNGPYWSIAYESWYYILFGIAAFSHGRRRVALLAAALVVCGPKILLLFPIWLLGVTLSWPGPARRIRASHPALLYVASWLLLAAFVSSPLPAMLHDLVGRLVGTEFQLERMTHAESFLADWVVGAIVWLNFASFREIAPAFGPSLRAMERPIRWAASYTLSLYLFHRPLVVFFTAAFHGDPRTPWFLVSVVSATLLAVWILGGLTEHRKNAFRSAVARLFSRLSRAWQVASIQVRPVRDFDAMP